eukprot:3930085-Rhodomonas_salina.1
MVTRASNTHLRSVLASCGGVFVLVWACPLSAKKLRQGVYSGAHVDAEAVSDCISSQPLARQASMSCARAAVLPFLVAARPSTVVATAFLAATVPFMEPQKNEKGHVWLAGGHAL